MMYILTEVELSGLKSEVNSHRILIDVITILANLATITNNTTRPIAINNFIEELSMNLQDGQFERTIAEWTAYEGRKRVEEGRA